MKKLSEKDIVKRIVIDKVDTFEEKTVAQLSTYSILRSAGGVFSLRLWWKGKTKKGDSRSFDIELDNSTDMAAIAMTAVEELLSEQCKVKFADKHNISKYKNPKTKAATKW